MMVSRKKAREQLLLDTLAAWEHLKTTGERLTKEELEARRPTIEMDDDESPPKKDE